MANNRVTITPDTNKVELTDQRRQILVTDNRTGTTINVTQTTPEIVIVSGRGPAGISGEAGPSGSQGPQGPAGTLENNSGASISGSLIVSGSNVDFSQATSITASQISASSFTGSYSGSFTGSGLFENDLTYSGEVFNVLGNVFVQGTLDASVKNFKIDHPTMPGYYLVHSSLEGPERGIYHRGKLKTSNIIHLPDYWKDLPVDDVDITVQLTPIGNACQHFIKSVSKEEIEVECECGKPHCYYIVHAQRYDQGKFELLEPKQTKSL